MEARRSPSAFARLYDATSPWLLRLVRRLVGEADAEDVLAETYLQVWRDLGRYDPQRAPVPVWLAVVAHSRALDLLRSRQARASHRSDEARVPGIDGEAQDPEAVVARMQQLRLLDLHCATALSPSEREVMALAYFEELSQSEIAQRLGMPLGTVKTRMTRAHQKLRMASAAPRGRAVRSVPAQAVQGLDAREAG